MKRKHFIFSPPEYLPACGQDEWRLEKINPAIGGVNNRKNRRAGVIPHRSAVRLFIAALLFFAFFAPHADAKDLPEYPSQKNVPFHTVEIKRGDTMQELFGEHAAAIARFNRIEPENIFPGLKIKVPDDLEAAGQHEPMPRFYSLATVEEKYILIDIEEQFLGSYEYGVLKFSAPISSAAPVCSAPGGGTKRCITPGGEFRVLALHRDHYSSLYKAPGGGRAPMPFAIMFYIAGGIAYWLHGGDLPGYPASHGCIRLMREDAKKLFAWAGGDVTDGKMKWVKNGFPIKIINAEKLYGERAVVR